MADLVRNIFIVLLGISIFFVVKKKKNKWIIIGILLALRVVLAVIPVENLFITFSSPEKAFHYVYEGDPKIIIEGESTDLIIADNNGDQYCILPKTKNGWKLGMGMDTKMIHEEVEDSIVVYVYQYRHSDEYYVMVSDLDGGENEVKDNIGSDFTSWGYSEKEYEYNFYCTFVKGLNEQYQVIMDDEVIVILL